MLERGAKPLQPQISRSRRPRSAYLQRPPITLLHPQTAVAHSPPLSHTSVCNRALLSVQGLWTAGQKSADPSHSKWAQAGGGGEGVKGSPQKGRGMCGPSARRIFINETINPLSISYHAASNYRRRRGALWVPVKIYHYNGEPTL